MHRRRCMIHLQLFKNWDNLGRTSQQTQNIGITFVQRRPNVFDVCPTLYTCYTNVLCLLGFSLRIFCKNAGSKVVRMEHVLTQRVWSHGRCCQS